jgi:hypothetical protein
MDLEGVRLTVYRRFAERGDVGPLATLAEELGAEPAAVSDAMRKLAHERHLVLDDAGEVVMAHPFSAIPLGFAVMGARTLWWGGCAWDSFALPHLVGNWMPDLLLGQQSALVSTRCPACDRAHAWNVDRRSPHEGDQVAHFLVPTAMMWDDVVHTCAHQRIFCSADCVDRWLDETGNARGYVMDLGTLWRLSAHWYDGRLDRGYRRREPAKATGYLRQVGLEGSFWGLD